MPTAQFGPGCGEERFRMVQGYRGLADIAIAIEHDLNRRRNAAHQELTTTPTV